jgi:aspartyl-tRNA(Asn)/glutamyl-tRNA(Gln) amidotransferase subunit A
MEPNRLPAHELLKRIGSGELNSADILNSIKARIQQIEPRVKSFARLPDFESLAGELLNLCADTPLKGIPVAIKDNICVKGQEVSCCSRILEGFVSPYDATVVEKLRVQGALLLGKTNMDEFAFGSSCETSSLGPTANPWDLNRVPGGSSGGAAASVAADETIFAIGSDTGGSIRQPASLCAVVGMKPTYGRVSRYGLIAFASSLDQIGPLTKDVTDCALLLRAIAGHDPKDSTSADIPVPDYTQSLRKDVRGLKIGLPKEYFIEGIDPEVKEAVASSLRVFQDLGAEVLEIHLPHTEYALAAYYIIAPCEASSNLARFDGVQYGFRSAPLNNNQDRQDSLLKMYKRTRGQGFGPEVKRRVILGTYALSSGYYEAYYLRALKVRTLIKRDFDEAFKICDCIVTPTSPTTAFKIGEKIEDPISMYLSDIFTIPANLAGIPAISIPCGFSSEGLPVGLQILGRPFDEETLFRVAYTYEQSTDWHLRKPKL